MISFGSLDEVVFIDQVNLRDRGLISPLSFTTLLMTSTDLMVDFPAGVYWGIGPSMVLIVDFPTGVVGGAVPSMGLKVSAYSLLENLDDNFEKKEFLAAAFKAVVSWLDTGRPYALGAGLLVCPLWKVDLAGTWRWNAALRLEAVGDTGIFTLVFMGSVPSAFVFSDDEDFCSQPIADLRFEADPPTTWRPVALLIVLDLVMPRVVGDVGALVPLSVAFWVPAVLDLCGVVPLECWDSLAVFSFMVAESTVFCLLKLEEVVWLLEALGMAAGGPVEPLLGLFEVAEMDL